MGHWICGGVKAGQVPRPVTTARGKVGEREVGGVSHVVGARSWCTKVVGHTRGGLGQALHALHPWKPSQAFGSRANQTDNNVSILAQEKFPWIYSAFMVAEREP